MKKHSAFLLFFAILAIQSFSQKKVGAFKQHIDENEAHEIVEHENEKNEYAHAHSSWYFEMLKKRPNLEKATTAFSQYFSTHAEDSKIKDRFVSWIQQAGLYKDKRGYAVPFQQQKKATNHFNSLSGYTPPPGSNTFGTWSMIGPANMIKTQCSNSNLVTGGFCDRVFVNPYNTQNLFAGFSYGGLWVSTDQGNNWQLTDGGFANGTNTYANRDYYYGEIESHKLNASLVYSATEAGLLKSTNSGINWTMCAQLNRNASSANRPYFISLATDDQNIVLSTFGKKLYRSADGGANWTIVFDNSSGGANHTSTSQYNFNTPFGLNDRTFNFFGLEADYSNPNHFYAGVWNSNNQACIYESKDKGLTFSLLVNLNTALSKTWSKTTMLTLKTIPSSQTKFFVYEQFAPSGNPYYKFLNDGTLLSSNPLNTYPEAFDIDWNNENILYEGQYGVYNSTSGFLKSTNGGANFVSPFNTSCNYIHADIRGVSAVGNIILIGNDGGISLSTDGAITVTGTGFGINSMDMWGFSSSPKSDICLSGLDHNQTFVRSYAADGGWTAIKGADAGVCSINPYDDHWLYYDWAYGVNKGYLNADGSVSESAVSTLPNLGSLQFHPNILFDIYAIQKSNNNILVHSTDNMETATVFKDFGVKVNSFKISREDPKVIYVLLNNLTIQKTIDGGTNWTAITPTSTVSGGQTNITAIEVGKAVGELWATYGNAQNTAKVLQSVDGGSSWKNITTTTLPAVAVSEITYQRGTNGGVYILTITNSGTVIWYRNNIMTDWQQVGSTLPMMGYLQGRLFVVPNMNKIRFGSSRGAWENDLYEPSLPIAGIAVDKITPLCSGDSIHFFNNSAVAPGAVTYSWQFPGGTPATSNLENPNISYNKVGNYAATLTITTATGSNSVTINNLLAVAESKCKVDTVVGNALSFSTGTAGGTALVTGYGALNNTNSFTISAWIKPAATQVAWAGLICANNETASNTILNFRNTNLELGAHWRGDLWPTATNLFAVANEWNHVALVVYPDSIRIYLNGKSFTYKQTTVPANWKDILLGGFNNRTDRNYNGLMDEIRIYSKPLSQDEIRSLRHLTISDIKKENSIVGYLQFNDAIDYLLDQVQQAQVGTRIYNTSNYTTSTAPVASGTSEKLAIKSSGVYNFNAPQVGISFPLGATVPNGDVWVSRLNSLPQDRDLSLVYPQSNYYIINNYGTNSTLTSPSNFTLKSVSLSSPSFVNYYRLNLIKRGENKDAALDWSAYLDSVQLVSNNTNYIDVPFTNAAFTSFGQFFITAKENYTVTLSGIQSGKNAVLNWKAIRDKNAKNYELQHSNDGINYSTINTANAITSSDTSNYSYSDNLVPLGLHYYRVKRNGIDGSIVYSNVITITIIVTAISPITTATNAIQVLPVPIKRGGDIKLQTDISGTINYQLLDLAGKQLFSSSFIGSGTLHTDGLSAGVYLIVFSSKKKEIIKQIIIE